MHGSVNALVDHVFLLFQAVEGFGSQTLEMVRFRPALTIEVWCPGRTPDFLFIPRLCRELPGRAFHGWWKRNQHGTRGDGTLNLRRFLFL